MKNPPLRIGHENFFSSGSNSLILVIIFQYINFNLEGISATYYSSYNSNFELLSDLNFL